MLNRRAVAVGAGTALAVAARSWAEPSVVSIPVELTPNRVVIGVTIAGQGPFRFVLDTGGVISLIDLHLAQRLGLQQRTQMRLGMNGGEDQYPIFDARDVVLGGAARQTSVAMAGTDMTFGPDMMGSLSAGLLTAADGELDFDDKVLRLYPAGGPPRPGWTRNANAIEHKGLPSGSAYLYAEVVLDGQPLRCALDTGFPQALRLAPNVASRLGLAARNWAPGMANGRPSMRLVRADCLDFGGATFQAPLLSFQPSGPWSSYYESGLIGLPLIRQFDLATDVKADVLWTRRNHQPAQPARYNLAGLWLDKAQGGARVGIVGGGSPAETAGLRPGDQIDGDFPDLLKSIKSPAGTVLHLTVRGNGGLRDVTLSLRDYL